MPHTLSKHRRMNSMPPPETIQDGAIRFCRMVVTFLRQAERLRICMAGALKFPPVRKLAVSLRCASKGSM
jgi:hypothetical protein